MKTVLRIFIIVILFFLVALGSLFMLSETYAFHPGDSMYNASALDGTFYEVIAPISFLGQDADHEGFPLTGGHGGLECEQCHASGEYSDPPSGCSTCHGDDGTPAEFDHDGIRECR